MIKWAFDHDWMPGFILSRARASDRPNQMPVDPSEPREHTRASADAIIQHFRGGGSLAGYDTDAVVYAMLQTMDELQQQVVTLELRVNNLEEDISVLKLLSGAPPA